ncbi:sensor domain-containing diguanylate cyclase [Vreelandella rituensis]|uniref:diguanylate cyclase n=1 Tax=Vreelandella rituensis TaxID=2282306 RepID=A0A368TN16_9GAMM|nr:GGDEF domain-containing protein [Halomonas rituensis]RCV86109.1 GGDEF domain-containing protein [Halomonas rituensis]
MSFIALMILVGYEARWVYPEIRAYFSQTGNLTGQQLATRSRVYLQEVQTELLVSSPPAQDPPFLLTRLELAYGLFDVAVYRQTYSCVEPSLAQLDRLMSRLAQGEVDEVSAVRNLLAPIQCLTMIEMSQSDLRGEAINEFADDTRRHQVVLTFASLVIFLLGLVFWWRHECQLRRTRRATLQTLEWMEHAMRDPLTGVGNRSALHQDVLAADKQSHGLLLVDIDYFKQYNDTLGHPRGDEMLCRLSALIDEALNHEASLYRLGGDEFAALLPCGNRKELAHYCEGVIERVHQVAFEHPAHPDQKPVTLSLGAVCFVAGDTDFSLVYEAADKALYHVKASGRDGWKMADCKSCTSRSVCGAKGSSERRILARDLGKKALEERT